MTICFALSDKDVGSRVIRAINRATTEGPVSLECSGTRFLGSLELSDATIASADFTGAEFRKGLRLSRVRFDDKTSFDEAGGSDLWIEEATFAAGASFRRLNVGNLKVKSTSFARYVSFDECVLGFATFRDVQFAAEARFRQIQSRGRLTLRSVRFGGALSFQESTLGALAFPGCEFVGPLQAGDLVVEENVEFVGAVFKDTRRLELNAGGACVLRDANFIQPLVLIVAAPVLTANGAYFERGADVLLDPATEVSLSDAAFLGPSRIATRTPGKGAPAKVTSLDRARAEGLTLEGLDLSSCGLARLHRLDDVLISGRGQLALAPAVVEGSYRREVLADEAVRRARGSRMLAWASVRWTAPKALVEEAPLEPQLIANTYRAMRKAREASHDYPGAADFYYGEMEMRREGAESWVERMVLTVYWLISGYGLRASRAMLVFAFAVLILATCFQTFGLNDPSSFPHTIGWTLSASISIVKPPVEKVSMTTVGLYLNVITRILGPALIALTVLALRSRVRR
jgi:uncharacterized protein YjbI with pentapeptide repeats